MYSRLNCSRFRYVLSWSSAIKKGLTNRFFHHQMLVIYEAIGDRLKRICRLTQIGRKYILIATDIVTFRNGIFSGTQQIAGVIDLYSDDCIYWELFRFFGEKVS